MMLEVPAAAISIETLLEDVDFVSIGSNDLVQYLMAADRDNPKVSHLCQPLSPPVLRVLTSVITACNAANKPVTLCGEMAGAPRAFVLLFGMGLRSFSMSPAFIPMIKDLTQPPDAQAGRADPAAGAADQDDGRRAALHGRADRRDRTESEAVGFGVKMEEGVEWTLLPSARCSNGAAKAYNPAFGYLGNDARDRARGPAVCSFENHSGRSPS